MSGVVCVVCRTADDDDCCIWSYNWCDDFGLLQIHVLFIGSVIYVENMLQSIGPIWIFALLILWPRYILTCLSRSSQIKFQIQQISTQCTTEACEIPNISTSHKSDFNLFKNHLIILQTVLWSMVPLIATLQMWKHPPPSMVNKLTISVSIEIPLWGSVIFGYFPKFNLPATA